MSKAWEWIIANWQTSTWQPLPTWVKTELNMHPALGVCSGMLITRHSANGLDEFIRRVNHLHV